ncbi:MAG: polysaccharide biosynthesis protein PslH, partial [Mucilaginibacter sp.]|nr:polysaccharide biosynthesis protein PslH [Mucilaginibacter sp.]
MVSLNAKKNHQDFNDDDKDLLSKIKYRAYNININVSVFEVAVNLLSKTSFNIDRYFDADFERLLIRELKNTSYDIIQFEGLF